MSLVKIRKVKSGANIEQTLNQIQDSIIASVNPVLNCPIVDSNLVQNISLDSTKDNQIAHGLDRKFIGYIATRIRNTSGSPTIFESSIANNSPEKFVILKCNVNLTADILFF